jgi:hypothetical protein
VFGNYQKDRNAIFLESINMVLEIWKGQGPYDLTGQFFNVTTGKTMIRRSARAPSSSLTSSRIRRSS